MNKISSEIQRMFAQLSALARLKEMSVENLNTALTMCAELEALLCWDPSGDDPNPTDELDIRDTYSPDQFKAKTDELSFRYAKVKAAIESMQQGKDAFIAKLGNKVDKVEGKELSTNDYTDRDKALVAEIPGKVNLGDFELHEAEQTAKVAELTASIGAKVDKAEHEREHVEIDAEIEAIRGDIESMGAIVTDNTNELDELAVAVGTKASSAAVAALSTAKQNKLTVAGDLSLTGDVLSITDMAKKRLFIDLWNTACGTYGRYNAVTGFFELNGLTDITYEQAIPILQNHGSLFIIDKPLPHQEVRTNIPEPVYPTYGGYSNPRLRTKFNYCDKLEVAAVCSPTEKTIKVDDLSYIFHGCNKLVTVLGTLQPSASVTDIEYAFKSCYKLKDIKINMIISSAPISLPDSPLISLDSLTYLVNSYSVGKSYSITVHPDVYAKLTDESNTDWHKVLTDASAKKISFATTN